MNNIASFASLIIQTGLDVYMCFITLRLLLQTFHARYYNPITHFIVHFTNFLVKPLQRIIPGYKGIDFAQVVLLILLQVIEIIVLVELRFGKFPSLLGTSIWTISALLNLFANIIFYALLLRALMSWLNTSFNNSLYEITHVITEPLLRHVRRFIPTWHNFDFSPLVLGFIIKAISLMLLMPLIQWGQLLVAG